MSKNQMMNQQAKKEVWKNVKDYEGYKVSNLGRVKSSKRNIEKVLTPQHQSGKDYVRLSKDGNSVKVQIESIRKAAFSNKK